MKSCRKSSVERGLEILGVVVSILAAIGIGVLYSLELIPNIVTALWMVFGLGVLGLIFVLIYGIIVGIAGDCNQFACCLQKIFAILMTGSIGTILMTLISLSAGVSDIIISSAAIIFVAVTGLFLGLLITGLIMLSHCLIFGMCYRCDARCDAN